MVRWNWDAGKVADLVRALSPHVGARTFHPEVEGPIKIWRSKVLEKETTCPEAGVIKAENGRLFVKCGVGVLEVLELQMPGAKRLVTRDFLRGNALGGAFDW